VALGRVGSVDFYPTMEARDAQRYYCAGSCGPVSAVTFSPDGRWLAFQAAHGTQDITPGLVTVVDLRGEAEPRSLEASATRTRVSFARDGNLLAANVLRVDDAGSVGLRAWSAASWRRVRDVPGALMPRGAVGPFALSDRVAAYQREGRMEVREVASGALVWAMPLALAFDAQPSAGEMTLELVAFSGNGELALSYESPARRDAPGALVLRHLRDGSTVAMYDVAHVSAVALAPDGGSFAYSTGAGRTYIVLARAPR
jgi:hypothetical protein